MLNPDVLQNHILMRLPPAEWEGLRPHAEYVHLAAGYTLAKPGDPASDVFFPESGLVSIVMTMESGHQVEIAAIGREGFLGAAVVLHVTPLPAWLFVQVESAGYRISSEAFLQAFDIAQMVGGPRHAVTAALHELREAGAADYLPGHVEVDEARLVGCACACYRLGVS